MGVQGLWQLLQPTGRPVTLESLEGKILAIDVSVWLHQSMKGMRDQQGHPVHNAHLHTLFNRVCKLLYYRIRPVFVFDGGVPTLKKDTLAKRRQRRVEASVSSDKAAKKLASTLLRHHAVSAVLGKPSSGGSSVVRGQPGGQTDMFALNPLPEVDRPEQPYEDDWEEQTAQRRAIYEEFEDFEAIDVEGEDFLEMPEEIQHEILTELQERQKKHSWANIDQLPEESSDFSQYQMSKLMRSSKLSQRIEDVRRKLNTRTAGRLDGNLVQEKSYGEIEARRVVSDDTTHYILIKGLKNNAGKSSKFERKNLRDTAPNKLMTSTQSLAPDLGVLHSNESVKSNRGNMLKSDGSGHDKNGRDVTEVKVILTSDMDSNDIILKCKEMMKTKQKARREVKPGETPSPSSELGARIESETCVSQTGGISQGDGKGIGGVSVDVYIDGNKGLNYVPITQSGNEDDARRDESENGVAARRNSQQTVGFVDLCENSGTSTVCAKSDGAHSVRNKPNLLTGVGSMPDVSCIGAGTERENGKVPDLIKGTERTRRLEESDQGTETFGNLRNNSENGAIETDDVTAGGFCIEENEKQNEEELSKSEVISIGSESSDDDFIEVTIDPSEAKPHDDLFPASIFLMGKENKEINISAERPLSSDIPESGRESPIQSTPQEGHEKEDTSPQEPEVPQQPEIPQEPEIDEFDRPRNLGSEFEAMTEQELEDIQVALETETTTLAHEKGKQERLAASITDQVHAEAQELLRLFGVPYVIAPTEAEAQCAFLDVTEQTHGTVTDDSDIWLFGGSNVYKNFFNQNKQVEHFKASDIDAQLLLDREALIKLAYLCGSDYTEGIQGVGPVTALEILTEFPGDKLQGLQKLREWWRQAREEAKTPDAETKIRTKLRTLIVGEGFPNALVYDAYLNPTVDDSREKFTWGKPDLGLLRDFAHDKMAWSRVKVDDMLLPMLKKLNEQQSQTHITNFFKTDVDVPRPLKSSRVKRVLKRMRDANELRPSSPKGKATPGRRVKSSDSSRAHSASKSRSDSVSKSNRGGYVAAYTSQEVELSENSSESESVSGEDIPSKVYKTALGKTTKIQEGIDKGASVISSQCAKLSQTNYSRGKQLVNSSNKGGKGKKW